MVGIGFVWIRLNDDTCLVSFGNRIYIINRSCCELLYFGLVAESPFGLPISLARCRFVMTLTPFWSGFGSYLIALAAKLLS